MIALQERVHAAPKPENWALDKLHQIFRVCLKNRNAGMEEDNLLSLSYGRIIRKDIKTADGLLPENFEGYQIVEPGNIVLRLTDLQNDKRSLRQGLVTERGIITSAYDAIEVRRDNEPRFWFYTLLALDLAKYYYSLGGGVRQSVKFSDFPNEWIYRPDFPTQRQIADFLDREITRIDSLIEKKRKLAQLLGERWKTTLDSYLAGIPLRTRVKFFSNYVTSGSRDWGNLYSDEGDLFIRIGNISGDGIDLDLSKRTFVKLDGRSEGTRTRLKEHDILVSITANLGSVAVVNADAQDAFINQHIALIRVDRRKCDPRFVAFAMLSKKVREQFQLRGNGGTKQGLSLKDIAEIEVPFPAIETQLTIREILDTETRLTKKVVDTVNTSLGRLQEYRSALITAAVTGQIDLKTHHKRGETDRALDRIEAEMSS